MGVGARLACSRGSILQTRDVACPLGVKDASDAAAVERYMAFSLAVA